MFLNFKIQFQYDLWLKVKNYLRDYYLNCNALNLICTLPNLQFFCSKFIPSTVMFRPQNSFSFWFSKNISLSRFLSERCPLIRAYGAIRFNAKAKVSSEWLAFGSFYFMIPQVHALFSFQTLIWYSMFVLIFIASAARDTKPKNKMTGWVHWAWRRINAYHNYCLG